MKIITKEIQLSKDVVWKAFTLTNHNDIEISFLNYGGTITDIRTPDRNGNIENIVLRYKNYQDYLANPAYLGAIIGRVAGRIPYSTFTIDNKTYTVSSNEGPHHLHGGKTQFHKVLWDTRVFESDSSIGVELTHTSPDGEDGYPGAVNVSVTYELTDTNEFIISYHGITDKPTPLALTNHTYFNLSGNLKRTIEQHEVKIDSDQFLLLEEKMVPTRNFANVENTPFDFRSWRKIEDGINSNHEQNKIAGNGYDHYFLFNHNRNNAVEIKEQQSGRRLTVLTDEPGMVLYTGNNLDQEADLKESKSQKYLGLCLETQNHPISFYNQQLPSIILAPYETYQSKTVFAFSVEE
ncbi:aldose epimerase family protein [Bacillus litorisediminis]|uniref:aldose epimerase family protein n=1 Tax=Bacillus litorisediminis TaxID=2922713 RepID=UPI001FAC9DAB|nr:aldose epimerase family protein [Bacillus litorisediminis]